MSGILNVLVASGGQGKSTQSFNVTAAIIPGSAFVGYSDGSAGTTGSGAAGSISGASLIGGWRIVEVSDGSGARLRIKGLSTNPGTGWLISVDINGFLLTNTSTTFTWDAVNNCATWDWPSGVTWNMTSGNTYNSNTITHN